VIISFICMAACFASLFFVLFIYLLDKFLFITSCLFSTACAAVAPVIDEIIFIDINLH